VTNSPKPKWLSPDSTAVMLTVVAVVEAATTDR
jgi:hypothetical protein